MLHDECSSAPFVFFQNPKMSLEIQLNVRYFPCECQFWASDSLQMGPPLFAAVYSPPLMVLKV